jgi:hypothetical protein
MPMVDPDSRPDEDPRPFSDEDEVPPSSIVPFIEEQETEAEKVEIENDFA